MWQSRVWFQVFSEVQMTEKEVQKMIGSRLSIALRQYFLKANQFLMARDKAEDVGCIMLADETVSLVHSISAATSDYLETSLWSDVLQQRCLTAMSDLEAQTQRLRNNEKGKRCGDKKSTSGATLADHGELRTGTAFKTEWSKVSFSSPGPITAEDMKYLASSIVTSGCISFEVVKQLGYEPRGIRHKSYAHIHTQLINTLPIILVHKPRSRHYLLLDGNEIPLPTLIEAMSGGSPLSGAKAQAKIKANIELGKASLDAEIDFWTEMNATEFVEMVEVQECADRLEQPNACSSKKLLEYPEMLEHIKTILAEHGEHYAQERRRTDKNHTVGIGTRRVQEMLHEQYGEDVGHVTVWRFYKCARKSDHRSIRDGGRYGMLETSTTKVRNNQFCTPHPRGRWCSSQVRDSHELLSDLTRVGNNEYVCAFFAVDDLARFPQVIDACSHMFARKNAGTTLVNDSRNWFDHNQDLCLS